MKKEDVSSKSTEELTVELKKNKSVSGTLAGVLLLLFGVTIYGLLMKEEKTTFIALIAVGISCSVILSQQINNIRKIKAELAKRGAETS